MGLPGLAGGPDLGFWVSVSPEMVGFPAPSGNLEPANQHVPSNKKGTYQGKLKSPRTPKFEEKPVKVWANKITLQTCNQSA